MLTPDEANEVRIMIADHHKVEVMPLHKQNREDYHDLRNTVQKLANTVFEFLNVVKGQEKERESVEKDKREAAENRDRTIKHNTNRLNLLIAMAAVLIALLTFLGFARSHDHALLSSDPTVTANYMGDR